jgi:hypothetical protein
MTPEDEAECRRIVFGYASELNDWEVQEFIFDRLQDGRHVAPSRAALVDGMTSEEFIDRHIDIFKRYIFPRDRKYGTNPGAPGMIGRDGSFFDVNLETMISVLERNKITIEVITSWGCILPGGKTMFVLKKKAGRWLIDSLKCEKHDGDWENGLIGWQNQAMHTMPSNHRFGLRWVIRSCPVMPTVRLSWYCLLYCSYATYFRILRHRRLYLLQRPQPTAFPCNLR